MPLTRVGKWTVVYGMVVAEVAAVAWSYSIWNGLNKSQDYRMWMYHHHPKVLDVFYWSCSLAGVDDARERDFQDWNIHKPKR